MQPMDYDADSTGGGSGNLVFWVGIASLAGIIGVVLIAFFCTNMMRPPRAPEGELPDLPVEFGEMSRMGSNEVELYSAHSVHMLE